VRKKITIPILSIYETKSLLLAWSKQFECVCCLDSNSDSKQNKNNYSTFDFILAVDSIEEVIPNEVPFESLMEFYKQRKDWVFGYLSYELKDTIEKLSSKNDDRIEFPLLHFFCPRLIFTIEQQNLCVYFRPELQTEELVLKTLQEILSNLLKEQKQELDSIKIQQRISKEEYISSVGSIQEHIQAGDIYEMNFCQEFYVEDVTINAVNVFEKLNRLSKAPFSCYYKLHKKHLLCASPERYLKKVGNKLISQPIKGTSKRGATKEEDEQLKLALLNDEKERSENIMIVDLVRNDLSKVAKRGSVKLEELCGLYSFEQVHQLISTISCDVDDSVSISEILKSTFPMGSMTGAPKIRAMQLIEQYEKTKRGLYSGAVGYISPEGDFDFNVVIRSILYNENERYISYIAGSAITSKSIPEKEYEECMTKAKAMYTVFSNS
jgi:para-aminobenzoate synthetase component 1